MTSSSSKFSLSVVLPVYNEEDNLRPVVTSIHTYFKRLPIHAFEIIIVNDGSTDRTAEVIEDLKRELPAVKAVRHPLNRGYGAALTTGFRHASLEYIFFMDADCQFHIRDISKLLGHKDHFDLVIGYRIKRADSWLRRINAWFYKQFVWLMLGIRFKDLDCAFKLFPKKVLNSLQPLRSHGALINAEFLKKAVLKGYTLKEVPVHHYQRRFGQQSGANLKVIVRMFREYWKLRKDLGR
ncbi:glycosyltransferase family 2 protein [Omnitrophica bacterium]|nr:glycosyltransferase family 2 protein [Candidatus Omnitrophota bacterium]